MLLNLKHFREAGGRPQLRVLHGEPDVRSGVERRRPRTGQPGTRRRSVNTIPPLVDERSEPRHHNQKWSQITTESGSNSQGAPSRGRQGRQGLEQACTLHALRRQTPQARGTTGSGASEALRCAKIPSRPRTSRSQIQHQQTGHRANPPGPNTATARRSITATVPRRLAG